MELLTRHSVLIADSAECPLGHMAMRLTRLGINPIYTNDADEAVLLAVQEASKISALAFPVSASLAEVDRIIKHVAPRAKIGPECLIPVGPAPDADRILAYRERNIRWAVWEPFKDADLRFVLANVLLRHSDGDVRLEPRIPGHEVKAKLYKGALGRDVDVIDISMGGAFLATDLPLPELTKVSLELEVATKAMMLRGTVRWVRRDYCGERDDMKAGMGVEFEPPPPELEAELRRFVQARIARYVVTAARPIG